MHQNQSVTIYSTLLQHNFLIWGLFVCIWDFGRSREQTVSGSSGIHGEFEAQPRKI